jgi:hypothetical protein
MTKGKKMIVVRGSEDGVLGVASNAKAAVFIAERSGYKASYKQLLKDLKRAKFSIQDQEIRLHTVDFEIFWLNE